MEFIIGVGVAIVSKLAEYTVVYARRLCHHTSDVDNLRAQVQQLNAERQRLQGRVDEASGRGEDIRDEVQNWLTSAQGISQQATDFLNNYRDRASFSCCSVQIPNLVLRQKRSREAKQMVEELQREIQAAQGFNVVASRPALQTVIAMRGDYEDFGSRNTILEDIMKALQDRNVSRIGIYGIGGIGKTTLAKEVARQVVEAKLFTQVAITTVSQCPDFSRMQTDIAEMIGLYFEGLQSIPERADRLQRQLKEQKSILIILDDIWGELNLIEVGIHLENEGCKILMTSRSEDVLRSMDADKNFGVDDLPASEAMNLFRTIVGDIVEQRDFKSLAFDVVRECGGLPLAIKLVAGPLKGQNNLSVWRNTLNQLRSIISPTNIAEPLREVYRSIRLSYDSLADEHKSLLLLCSLYGEDKDIEVEDLRMIGVGCGLFQNVSSLVEARVRVESLVDELKDRCLLLGGRRSDMVKMHDVIRDVAIAIASNEGGMHTVAINELEDCQNKKKLKDSKAISLLPHPEFNQLPESLECSELELFLLHSGQGDPIPIPNHFFEGSKDQLKSLFLYKAKLVSVSPSFHSLQNLETLCLRGCVLEDVNFIGDLKNLQILDLSKSTIKQLPVKVAQLSRLQLLNLEGCKDLELIEPNVISSLTQLEELYFSECFDKWEVGEVDVSERSNVNLAEIENLRQLTSLSLRVLDAKTFPKDFKFSEKLDRYRISIGGPSHYYLIGISRLLLLNLREKSQLTALGLESLMKSSEWLLLNGLIDVKNVVYDLDSEGFCNLKGLDLLNSDGVQYIVACVNQQIHPHKAFPVLDSMRLKGLRNLEKICHGKLPEDSFKNLKGVRVSGCDKLKNVFPLSIFKRLHFVEVLDCEIMEEIVGHVRSEDDGAVEFPKLRLLELGNLPKMVKFMSWSEAEAAGGSSSVESPDPLFGEKLEFPGLEILNLYGLNAVESVWQLQTACYMVNLTRLSVRNCNSLKYLFSLAVAERLVKLKNLQVENCEVLEYIVVTKKLGEEGRSGNKILFPQLESLMLSKLSTLRTFCHEEDRQDEVGAAAREYDRQLITRLRELRLDNVPKLRHLSGEPENDHLVGSALQPVNTLFVSFQNLIILEVSFCHQLTYLLASSMATSLVQLQQMRVTDCDRMIEIITDYTEGEITEDEHDREFVFPQLEILVFRRLPNLGRFFSGNNVMRFPKLKKLFVSQCPKMRSFSNGIIISSPMLNTIITEISFERMWESTYDLMNRAKAVREHWDSDVNTTIRQLR